MKQRDSVVVALGIALTLIVPAHAARVFTKNTANYCSYGVNGYGVLVNGASVMSMGAWVVYNSLSVSANVDRVLSSQVIGSSTGFTITSDGSSHLRIGGRSKNGDTFQSKTTSATIPLHVPVLVGGVVDFGAQVITPYLNGVADGGGSVTFGASTYTDVNVTAADFVGTFSTGTTPTANDAAVDGIIMQAAMWKNTDLGKATPPGFGRWAQHADPKHLAPGLVFYDDLQGTRSPERDIASGATCTITGSLPPIGFPFVERVRPRP